MTKKLSSIKNIMPKNVSQFPSTTIEAGALEYTSSNLLTDQERRSAVQTLVTQKPLETEKQLRSQIQYDLSYQIKFQERYDNEYGVIVDHIDINNSDLDELSEALKTVVKSLMPLTDDELIKRLTVMLAVQTKQSMKSDDLTLKIKSLVQLINYDDQIPADIIIYSINHLTRELKWYPAYAEIIKVCGHLMDVRKKLYHELHKRIKSLAYDKQIMHNRTTEEEQTS